MLAESKLFRYRRRHIDTSTCFNVYLICLKQYKKRTYRLTMNYKLFNYES